MVDPWFYLPEEEEKEEKKEGVVVLGRYTPRVDVDGARLTGTKQHQQQHQPASLVSRDHGIHRTLFSAAPNLSAMAIRAVAEAAGVHLFLGRERMGDGVEAVGKALVLRAVTGPAGLRRIRFPSSFGQRRQHWQQQQQQHGTFSSLVVLDEAGRVVCPASCVEFESHAMLPGEVAVWFVSGSAGRTTMTGGAEAEGVPRGDLSKRAPAAVTALFYV